MSVTTTDVKPPFPTFFRLGGWLRKRAGLWLLGLLVAVSMCGAEIVRSDLFLVRSPDHHMYVKLVASTVIALENGQFPPRVGEMLSQNVGNPYHQFYSPAGSFIPASLAILTGNLFYGICLTLVLMTALAFVWAHKLCLYLGRDRLWALAGAFIFVCAPYFIVDRVQRAAFAEYFVLCLMPLIIYLQLRALANFSIKSWAKVTLAWALALHCHFIACMYLVAFSVVFWALHGLMLLKPAPGRRLKLMKYLKRTGVWFAVGFSFLALSAWYFIPAATYGDLLVKNPNMLTPASIYAYLTPIMGVFSLVDMPWLLVHHNQTTFLTFQAGFVLMVGFSAFIYYNWRNTASAFAWPLWLTGAFVLVLVIFPDKIYVGPLKALDIAQFSYRFLGHFVIAGLIMSLFALKAFVSKMPDLGLSGRKILALMVICFSLVLAAPYLEPKGFPTTDDERYPKPLIKAQLMLLKAPLTFDEAYARGRKLGKDYPPLDESVKLIQPAVMPSTADRTFVADLSKETAAPGFDGRLYFDVLYYPGLQDITVTVDSRPFEASFDTLWAHRPDLGEKMPFHGLVLEGLPKQGELKVRVKFVGSHLGNYISLGALIVLAIASLAVSGRKWALIRAGQKGA